MRKRKETKRSKTQKQQKQLAQAHTNRPPFKKQRTFGDKGDTRTHAREWLRSRRKQEERKDIRSEGLLEPWREERSREGIDHRASSWLGDLALLSP